ncbi:MAG: TonB-dependent receptor, partial [Cyclobacteriaceae bacterium]|nr:TonB-dependent receptor [Cyclobacteriaceae bacterium]
KLKDGDYESWKVKGSINPFSTKAFFEGPLVKDKVSIMGSLRTTYSDWVLSLAKNPDVKQSTFNFMDVSFRYSHRLNEKSLLNINLYNSKDYFRYSKQFGFNYQTTLAQILYTYNINDNLFFDTSLSWSQYLSNQEELSFEKKFQFGTRVNYKSLKNKFTYYLPSGTEISGGTNTILYIVNPGEIEPIQGSTTVSYDILNDEYGIENALFVAAKWEMNSALGFEAGLRWNNYTLKGPFQSYSYLNDSYTLNNIQDTLFYEKGEKIKTYSHLEPRISFRLKISPDLSMKGGYARAHQYINQISNVTTPSPTDVWKLSSDLIKPTSTHNYSLGLFKNIKENKYEFSGEVYYRYIDQLYGLRDFAVISMNDHLETELLDGIGRTYGLELSIKKKSGDVEGWISYTLSRSERKIEEINLGDWHLSDFDKPHDLSVVAKFNITNRKVFSLNFNYGVGRPATVPVGSYRIDQYLNVPIYSSRNQFRLPSYHRLDISYLVKKGYNKNKKVKKSWVFSVYNVYGRKNPF